MRKAEKAPNLIVKTPSVLETLKTRFFFLQRQRFLVHHFLHRPNPARAQHSPPAHLHLHPQGRRAARSSCVARSGAYPHDYGAGGLDHGLRFRHRP